VLARFAARALAAKTGRALKVWEIALPVAPQLLICLGLIVLPYTSAAHGHAVWIAELSPLVGAPVVVAMILATLPVRRLPVAVWPGIVSLCFIWASYPSAIREVARNYDVTAVGALIGEQQRNGRPIAFLGGYLGEFHFAGRLTQPIEEVDNQSLGAWAAAHPNGLLVDRPEQRPSGDDAAVLYAQPYRSSFLVLRDAAPR